MLWQSPGGLKESVSVLSTLDFPVVICKSQIAERAVSPSDESRPPERPALSSVHCQWGVKQTYLQAFVP